jgi:hypothetical protein
VAQQRQQRAVAFVLNKWDREAIGLQYDHRAVVEHDFRRVLAAGGFESPVLFKVSALYGAQSAPTGPVLPGDAENQLPEFLAWLETGLDRSMSGTIQARRRRAAWGAVWPATPGLFGTYARLLTWCAAVRLWWGTLERGWGVPHRGGLAAHPARATGACRSGGLLSPGGSRIAPRH